MISNLNKQGVLSSHNDLDKNIIYGEFFFTTFHRRYTMLNSDFGVLINE